MDDSYLKACLRAPETIDDIPAYFDYEAFYEWAVAQMSPGAVLVEVGAYLGKGAATLFRAAKEHIQGGVVFAVDHCVGSAAEGDGTGIGVAACMDGSYCGLLHRNLLAVGAGDVRVLIMDSAAAAECFADDSVGMVFLDACHEREGVLRDLHAWGRKIRVGGILAGHDYLRPEPGLIGVTEAVETFFRRRLPAHRTHAHIWAVRREVDGWVDA